MSSATPDKQALKILFDTYWSSSGWKGAGNLRWKPTTPPEDFDFALRAGTMFRPRKLTHAGAIERTIELRDRIKPRDVGTAFAYGLESGAMGLRSALGSYAVALNMPRHKFKTSRGEAHCVICGDYRDAYDDEDINILSFERHKWGGVRHTDPSYIAFDLERFEAEYCPVHAKKGMKLLQKLISAVEQIPPGGRRSELVRATKPIIPGNDAARLTVLTILGYAGVFQIPNLSGFFDAFTNACDRKETSYSEDDWEYPIRWWSAGNGINNKAVQFWFGRV